MNFPSFVLLNNGAENLFDIINMIDWTEYIKPLKESIFGGKKWKRKKKHKCQVRIMGSVSFVLSTHAMASTSHFPDIHHVGKICICFSTKICTQHAYARELCAGVLLHPSLVLL